MKFQFQKNPWDVYISISYILVVATILLVVDAGNLTATLLVLFAPGYLLAAALFPREAEISWFERFALSFGLSIGVIPLIVLMLEFTPFGIRLRSIVASIALFSAIVGYAAVRRRVDVPEEERLSVTLDLKVPSWNGYGPGDKLMTVLLATSVFVAAGTVTYLVLAIPRSSQLFTEFYILGPGGSASDYPTRLNISQSGTVLIGIVNHEATVEAYTVQIDLVRMQVVYDPTLQANETVEISRSTWSWMNVTLPDGGNWTRSSNFSLSQNGFWKVEFILYKDGDLSTSYRDIYLYVTVT